MAQRILDPFAGDIEKCKRLQVKRDHISNLLKNELSDFVTSYTIDFFNRFELSTDFLLLDPTEWESNLDYITAFNSVKDMKVVNDSAERGVKLISDFHQSITSKEDEKQFLLQLVSEHRKQFPSYTKKTLITKE